MRADRFPRADRQARRACGLAARSRRARTPASPDRSAGAPPGSLPPRRARCFDRRPSRLRRRRPRPQRPRRCRHPLRSRPRSRPWQAAPPSPAPPQRDALPERFLEGCRGSWVQGSGSRRKGTASVCERLRFMRAGRPRSTARASIDSTDRGPRASGPPCDQRLEQCQMSGTPAGHRSGIHRLDGPWTAGLWPAVRPTTRTVPDERDARGSPPTARTTTSATGAGGTPAVTARHPSTRRTVDRGPLARRATNDSNSAR